MKRKPLLKAFFASLLLVNAPAALAEDAAPELYWPLGCTLYQDCFIEHYPDLKIGTDPVFPLDYKCGERTRMGNLGTEIIFTDRKTAHEGKPVLAAAEGRVVFVKDGLKDSRQYSKESKRACGNHVVVRHNPSYSTKYCFLRETSVTVKPGDKVQAGDVLGQIGSSGATEAPKLYFEVLKNQTPVDPFTGRELHKPSECFSLNDRPLWHKPIAYPPVGIIAASFAQGYPTAYDVAFDATVQQSLSRSLRTLTAWVRLFGVLKGDKEQLTIYQPNGQIWYQTDRIHPAHAPFWTSFASANFKPEISPAAGEWRAVYTLERDGEELLNYAFFTTIQ